MVKKSVVIFQQSMTPEEQNLWLEYHEMGERLRKLEEYNHLSDIEKKNLNRCKTILVTIEQACHAHFWGLKWPNYTYAWSSLRRIRRELVQTIDAAELEPLLKACYDQLPYMGNEEQVKELRKRISNALFQIQQLVKQGHEVDVAARDEIQRIMSILDDAQDDFWYRLEEYKIRVAIFVILTLAVLIIVLSVLREQSLVMVTSLGFLGGLLGRMLRSEDFKTHVGTFYVHRIQAFLSPLLGALGALGVYFLMQAGVINLLPPAESVEQEFYHYGIAFLSGFSERFLSKFLEGSDKDSWLLNKPADAR